MTASENLGTHRDKELYPHQVESGIRGTANYQWFGITHFNQCTCGRINCVHLQAWREWMQEQAVTQ